MTHRRVLFHALAVLLGVVGGLALAVVLLYLED